MLRTRVITALILLPVVLVCSWLGHPWLTILVAVALGLGAYEFACLARRAGSSPAPYLSAAVAVLLALERGFCHGRYVVVLLVLALLLAAIWHVLRARNPEPLESWASTVLSGLYVGFLGSHVIALRALPDGLAWLALAIVTTWVSDSGAYFAGSAWGKHKMAPHLSPNKSWEGAAAGLLSALACGVAIALMGGLGVSYGLVAGLMIGTLSPFGDLAISMIKRQVGVKDTSGLFPGHGGMLDRLDSLLFSVPLVYCCAVI